jgi:peptide chain release factor 2
MFSNPADPLNCFLDIQAGAGGTEACDWAVDAAAPVPAYCERKGFKTEVMEESEGDVAGIKSATIKIEGEYAFGHLRTETGVHRLVRKSPFDSSGGRHTSFASVFVYPEVDDSIEIDINPADVRVDTYRASGAGGQHINKTDSAVRLTHIPTGIVVQCQNDRSQHRNRDEAWQMLRSRLYEHEMRKRMEEQQKLEATKTDVGWGHQIRSYVLDQSRIKDLRTNVETSATPEGARRPRSFISLDQFIAASLVRPNAGHPEYRPIMTEPIQTNAAPEGDENKIIAERREKLRELREHGVAYPNDFRPTHNAADLQTQYADADKETLEANPLKVAVAGRMMLKRVMGKASFATVRDGSGRPDPVLHHAGRRRRGNLRRVQALGPGRHRRRRGHAVQDQDRRAVGQGDRSCAC